jgi:hypothetical protein
MADDPEHEVDGAMHLYLIQLTECQHSDGNTLLTFRSRSGSEHKIAVSKDVRESLLRELQIEAAHQNVDLLSLTLTGTSNAVSAVGKALVLRTRELGTIAVVVDDRSIDSLQQNLAELAAVPPSSDSRN